MPLFDSVEELDYDKNVHTTHCNYRYSWKRNSVTLDKNIKFEIFQVVLNIEINLGPKRYLDPPLNAAEVIHFLDYM